MGDEQFLQCEHYSSKGFSIQFKDRCGFEIGSKAASVQNHFLVRKSMVSNNIQNQWIRIRKIHGKFQDQYGSGVSSRIGMDSESVPGRGVGFKAFSGLVWVRDWFKDH